jgi:hypothetical protein
MQIHTHTTESAAYQGTILSSLSHQKDRTARGVSRPPFLRFILLFCIYIVLSLCANATPIATRTRTHMKKKKKRSERRGQQQQQQPAAFTDLPFSSLPPPHTHTNRRKKGKEDVGELRDYLRGL